MSNINIWEKYKQIYKIGYGTYGKVYKVQNIETEEYFAMKEIEKEKFEGIEDKLLNEVEIMKKINTENSVLINEVINNKEYLYIIMDLCEYDLENYIKRRKKPISINEIKEVLNQLNNVFKIMNDKKIIHRDLKPSNILISLDRLDKCLIKLSDYGSSKFNNLSNTITNTLNGTPITMAPEILKGENYSFKSDIWSLGIIIYFMLNKKYPYNGKNEVTLLKDINSGKKLKLSNDDKLNDLINKMLKININERISWDEYFNHPFFNQDNIQLFKFNCDKHSKIINNYCKECKKNICDNCIKEHSTHNIIPFNKIGLNDNEIKRIENIFKEIDNKLNIFNKNKKDVEDLLITIKSIKENKLIY
jgi:serine/threonine protein kinase